MKCVVCKHGETREGNATVTVTRDGGIFVVKRVPAYVCGDCGEEYIDENVTARLEQFVADALTTGVQAVIREYPATP